MRGWEHIGRVCSLEWDELALDRQAAHVVKGDIIAVAAEEDGELRFGTFQVAHVGEDIIVARGRAGVRGSIPSIAFLDHVYVARALGEYAIATANPTTP